MLGAAAAGALIGALTTLVMLAVGFWESRILRPSPEARLAGTAP